MKIFGLRIISESEYQYLRQQSVHAQVLYRVRDWFSGWRDLDIIWEYILSKDYYGDISSARLKYANTRGTNEYGKPTEPTNKPGGEK